MRTTDGPSYFDYAKRPFAPLLAAILIGLAPLTAAAATPSDALRQGLRHAGDVNDFAHILTSTQRARLEEFCQNLDDKTPAKFVVVTIDSLQGGDIDDFANKLFKQWGIGDKGKDNGLLLLIAIRERKARLEVGYQLEPIVPDTLAGRILDEQLFPAFKQQRYADGIQAALGRAGELVQRGKTASAEDRRRGPPPLTIEQQIFMILFLSIFVAVGSYIFGTGVGAKVGANCAFGLVFIVFPLILGWAVAAPWAPMFQAVLGLLLLRVGIREGRRNPAAVRANRARASWQGFGGGGSGLSWGGGGFGGGGFGGGSGSFGGGCSGGGGASGGW